LSWEKEVAEIRRRNALAVEQGGAESVARQHEKGRLTVRERIDALLDPQSFRELGRGAGASEQAEDGSLESFTPANFVLGFGAIDGRRCIVGGEDFTLKGGSPSAAGLRKSVYAEELACRYRVPLVRLHEGGGGAVGGASGKNVGPPVNAVPRFRSVAQALATVPVASAALGPVAGLPAARLVASHFSVMSAEGAQVLIAGPAVVQRATGKRVTKEELGGAQVHGKNGVVDNTSTDEHDALHQIRRFLGYLPSNVWELPPSRTTDDPAHRRADELLSLVPRNRRHLYDMRHLLVLVLDRDTFFEIGPGYGRGLITGLARLNGQPVGIVANDCAYLAGAMTADGAHKMRRFVELCETFHLPIVSFVDQPGFMIGSEAEQAATIRFGTTAVLTTALSTVPWASVIVRRSFGVAQAAHYGPDGYVLAWPSAEVGALPVEGGVAVAYHREIAAADDPDAKRRELEETFAARQTPFPRGEQFSVHDVIDPRETRPLLCDWIEWVQPILPSLVGPSAFPVRP
jgi:acetyl-CoA carboxylase carboxyltransferase component